jgi:hypothetical protein
MYEIKYPALRFIYDKKIWLSHPTQSKREHNENEVNHGRTNCDWFGDAQHVADMWIGYDLAGKVSA